MSDRKDPQNAKDPQKQNKIDRIHDKLDEFGSKVSGPNAAYGSTPGYDEKPSDDELKKTADAEGVTLRRHADGSHEAIDDSAARQSAEFKDSQDSADSDTSSES